MTVVGIEIIGNVERVGGENTKRRLVIILLCTIILKITLRVLVKYIDHHLQKLEAIARGASNIT